MHENGGFSFLEEIPAPRVNGKQDVQWRCCDKNQIGKPDDRENRQQLSE